MQKTGEANGDLIGNKIADKITSVNKAKPKDRIPSQEIYIPTKKCQQVIDDLRLV